METIVAIADRALDIKNRFITRVDKKMTNNLLRLRHIDPFGPIHFVHLLRISKVSWTFSMFLQASSSIVLL
jgi:hypothetical protein